MKKVERMEREEIKMGADFDSESKMGVFLGEKEVYFIVIKQLYKLQRMEK